MKRAPQKGEMRKGADWCDGQLAVMKGEKIWVGVREER